MLLSSKRTESYRKETKLQSKWDWDSRKREKLKKIKKEKLSKLTEHWLRKRILSENSKLLSMKQKSGLVKAVQNKTKKLSLLKDRSLKNRSNFKNTRRETKTLSKFFNLALNKKNDITCWSRITPSLKLSGETWNITSEDWMTNRYTSKENMNKCLNSSNFSWSIKRTTKLILMKLMKKKSFITTWLRSRIKRSKFWKMRYLRKRLKLKEEATRYQWNKKQENKNWKSWRKKMLLKNLRLKSYRNKFLKEQRKKRNFSRCNKRGKHLKSNFKQKSKKIMNSSQL